MKKLKFTFHGKDLYADMLTEEAPLTCEAVEKACHLRHAGCMQKSSITRYSVQRRLKDRSSEKTRFRTCQEISGSMICRSASAAGMET